MPRKGGDGKGNQGRENYIYPNLIEFKVTVVKKKRRERRRGIQQT
jgi:hypothetical protein